MGEDRINKINQVLRDKYRIGDDSIKSGVERHIPTIEEAVSKRSSVLRNVVIKDKMVLKEKKGGLEQKGVSINLDKDEKGTVKAIAVKCTCGKDIKIDLQY